MHFVLKYSCSQLVFVSFATLTHPPSTFRWKLQRTGQGRVCYVDCYTKTTQWDRPTRPAYEMVQGRQQSSAVTTHNSSTTETHVQVSQASGPTCYPRSGTDPSRRPSPQQPNPASQNDSTYGTLLPNVLSIRTV